MIPLPVRSQSLDHRAQEAAAPVHNSPHGAA